MGFFIVDHNGVRRETLHPSFLSYPSGSFCSYIALSPQKVFFPQKDLREWNKYIYSQAVVECGFAFTTFKGPNTYLKWISKSYLSNSRECKRRGAPDFVHSDSFIKFPPKNTIKQ